MRTLVVSSALLLLCVGFSSQLLLAASRATLPPICPHVLHEFPNSPEVIVRTMTDPPFKISLHTKLHDEIRWRITENGTYYDACLTSAARSVLYNVKPGLVIDVGANIGWLSLYALAMGHRVVAFEPNVKNLARLCQSLSASKNGDRISLLQVGVSDSPGRGVLNLPKNPGAASFLPFKSHDAVRTEEASLVTLDSILKEQRALFLKVDVEGFEAKVLRGARAWLAKRSVSAIYIEFSPRDLLAGNVDPQSVVLSILSYGYSLQGLSSGGVPMQVVPVDQITRVCNATAWHQCDLFFKRKRDATRQTAPPKRD